jgi:photosystem II stability/assembly factor-like uncharacterized protein
MFCFRCLAVFFFLVNASHAIVQDPAIKPTQGPQPESPLVQSFKTYQRMKKNSLFGLEWIGLGPVVNSARVESVQLDPSKPGTIYAAFGSGNLWKTTSNGVTWRPIFENQASHGIGDIALGPSDPDVIYLGTGASLKKARNFTIPGTGIYRSDDGGEKWRHLGLNDSWHIGEISVHPENPDVVVVAVLGHFWSSNPNRGLYRTEDGGKNWQHVLNIDENTGANDIVWAKDNTDVVYASSWENYPGVSGENSSVHKSIDGGRTWKKCDNGLPQGKQIGRIGLAVSQADSNKVYALIDNRELIPTGAAQVFKSLDGGQSWEKTHKESLHFFSRIGWYFADIYVNPQNDEEIFALGVRIAHSVDGGKTFKLLHGKVAHINPSAASGLHLDHCEMWINPSNSDHLVLASDGGLYQSFDKGNSWMHFNNLPTGEFYDIAVDNQSPYQIYAGAQDDATVFGPAKEWNPTDTDPWNYLWIDPWNGGDGCITQVDPDDPNTVYFSAQEGAFRRKDMATNRSKRIRPQLPKDHEGKLDFNFVGPMIISPHDSQQLFLAGNYVFQSDNRGDQWSVVSADLAVSQDEERKSLAVSAIAESPLARGLIYAGTDKGAMWVSEDGGKEWSERTEGFPIGYVRNVFPSKHEPARAYAAVSGLNYDDFQSHFYCTQDRGLTWKSISANLPDEPANVIIEDPNYEDILFAGSFRAVYLSLDRGSSWSLLGNNLPACSVADLAIQEREQDLIVATHGRGIYKLNLAPIYEWYKEHRENNEAGKSEEDILFSIPPAEHPYVSDIRPGLNFRECEKTPISFWLQEASNVTLTVWDVAKDSSANKGGKPTEDSKAASSTEPLASFSLVGRKGLNQFRWDLILKSQTSSKPYFINFREYIKTGEYRVQLETQAGTVLEKPLSVVAATEEE